MLRWRRTRSRISIGNETSTSWQIGSWNAEERVSSRRRRCSNGRSRRRRNSPRVRRKPVNLPTLTIVAGPNGSGKTTLTKWVREEFQDNPVLDPDAIASSLQTTGATRGSAIDAGREVLLKAERLIADGQSLTVETTLSGHTYRILRKAGCQACRGDSNI